MQGAKAIKG